MSTYATRLASHASLIRSKSVTFRRLLLFFMSLLWESSPRLLVASIFCATASRALTVLSLLGTLKLAYVIFYPPPRLVAALQPAVDITGLAPIAIIAATSAIIIIGIFTAAAIMKLVEAQYLDKTKRQFELFLTENVIKANANCSNWGPDVPSNLEALSRLTNNTINALSLAAILIGIWALLLVMSPPLAIAMILCASVVFALVLYFGSRTRKKTAQLKNARKELRAALMPTSPGSGAPGPETTEGKFSPDISLVMARMRAAHDARSRISEFRARLDSMALISTGALVGIAILMMIDANVVYVILTLLLVRFFLNDGRILARQLQGLSDELDVIDWARTTYRGHRNVQLGSN